MKKQKSHKKLKLFGGITAAAFGLASLFTIFGLSNTVYDVKNAVISREASAILASAGLEDEEIISLPVIYYDQQSDACVNVYDSGSNFTERQFEWVKCGYFGDKLEQGLVDFELDGNYLPVATGAGKLTTNRGVTKESFARWFNQKEGLSTEYPGTIEMSYSEKNAEFSFYQDNFYPLDNAGTKQGDTVNNDGHNHLFTMNFSVPFVVLADGNEHFAIEADDDTFVFIGNKLALDMGGIHGKIRADFEIRANGEVYTSVGGIDFAYSGITLNQDDSMVLRVFHADRNSASSVFNVKFSGMNLTVENVNIAKNDIDTQVAYDLTDPTYIAPLGETKTVEPSKVVNYVIVATMEGALVVIFAVLAVLSARYLIRKK